jgi:hypothetical protein
MAERVEVKLVFGVVQHRVGFYFFAVVVDEDVLHNRENPCLEISVGLEFVAIVQCAIRSFLIQILGILHILRQIIGEGVQHACQSDQLAIEFYTCHGILLFDCKMPQR